MGPNGAGYKHFYFNCNLTTAKLWFIVVTGIIIVYEVTKYAVRLITSGLKIDLDFSLIFVLILIKLNIKF